MKSFIKKNLKLGIRIGISSVLIVLLIWQQDFTLIVEKVFTYNPIYLLFALVCLIAGTIVSCIRWKTILQISKHEVPLADLIILYVKGYFYNNFLPTQMGGDLYKSVALGRKINDQSTALFSVFMDRFGGLLVLLALSLFGISTMYGWYGILFGIVVFIVGLVLYFPTLNFFSKKIKFLVKFEEASKLLIKDPKRATLIILYSLIVQLFSFTMVYILFLGFGITIPIWAVIAYMPLTSLSSLIPSFNGFGTQELVYAALFSTAGVTPELSIAVSVLVHTIRLLMSLAGGVLILMGKK